MATTVYIHSPLPCNHGEPSPNLLKDQIDISFIDNYYCENPMITETDVDVKIPFSDLPLSTGANSTVAVLVKTNPFVNPFDN